jgi:threonine synthase
MVSVQAVGCAPFVRAMEEDTDTVRPWEGATTVASGLRVPRAVGDKLVLEALRQSEGTAVAITDEAMLEGSYALGAGAGALGSPEGGACLVAALGLAEGDWIKSGETVVLFNTGTALSYVEAWDFEAPE